MKQILLVILILAFAVLAETGSLPAQGDSSTGSLRGKVRSASGSPLGGARIQIDSGQEATSAGDGRFLIPFIPPGRHGITISLPGYRQASGTVNLTAGTSKSMLVELTPLSGTQDSRPTPSPSATPMEVKGALRVVAHAYDDGYYHWFVQRIEVTELGGGGRTWSNSWDRDFGDTYQEVNCDGVVVGRSCRIKISWRGRRAEPLTNTWERKIYTQYQTESFDSPY